MTKPSRRSMDYRINNSIFDGFVKSPSAIRQAVRQAHGPEQGRRTHGPEQGRRTHGPEQSRRAALRFTFSHCGVLISTPHSQRFARLASGAFYCAVWFVTLYETIRFDSLRKNIVNIRIISLGLPATIEIENRFAGPSCWIRISVCSRFPTVFNPTVLRT